MSWMEEMLILGGMSLDVFAAMTSQGSVVAKIEKKQLAGLCGVTAVCQAAALSAGSFLSTVLREQPGSHDVFLETVLAAAIFLGLGIRLMAKAWKNEQVAERRKEGPDWKTTLIQTAAAGAYALLIGIALGFLGFSIPVSLAMLFCLSILGTVLGMYTGYRLGGRPKSMAQIAGALLLAAAGIDVMARYFWGIGNI